MKTNQKGKRNIIEHLLLEWHELHHPLNQWLSQWVSSLQLDEMSKMLPGQGQPGNQVNTDLITLELRQGSKVFGWHFPTNRKPRTLHVWNISPYEAALATLALIFKSAALKTILCLVIPTHFPVMIILTHLRTTCICQFVSWLFDYCIL